MKNRKDRSDVGWVGLKNIGWLKMLNRDTVLLIAIEIWFGTQVGFCYYRS